MTSSNRTYSSRNGADVDLIFGADRVATAAEALPGDVLLSRRGEFLTVTAPGRVFLGEHIVDYVTESGAHGTAHFRAGVPVMIYRPRQGQLPQRYAVTVNVVIPRNHAFGLPTFYLDAATQGIVSEEHAAGIARTIVDNGQVPGATYHITAVAL